MNFSCSSHSSWSEEGNQMLVKRPEVIETGIKLRLRLKRWKRESRAKIRRTRLKKKRINIQTCCPDFHLLDKREQERLIDIGNKIAQQEKRHFIHFITALPYSDLLFSIVERSDVLMFDDPVECESMKRRKRKRT